MSTTEARRKAELEAKRAKLAELKRAKAERSSAFAALQAQPPAGTAGSHSSGPSPPPTRDRTEIDNLVSSLLGDRPRTSASTSSHSSGVPATPTQTDSAPRPQSSSASLGLATAPLVTILDVAPPVVKEVVTYSKEVQTMEVCVGSYEEGEQRDMVGRETEEELRARIRVEVEEEQRRLAKEDQGEQQLQKRDVEATPELTEPELDNLRTAPSLASFLDRSTRVLSRALAEENYDILKDYSASLTPTNTDTESSTLTQIHQFYDTSRGRGRAVTALDFCTQHPELVLASYTKGSGTVATSTAPGLIQIFNSYADPGVAEYSFTAPSDILSAQFSPFDPHIVVGGLYSGQIMLWDLRAGERAVLRSPLTTTSSSTSTGLLGHSSPVYATSIIGTQNAASLISVSTDGHFCAWSLDQLSAPLESLPLISPLNHTEIAPTCRMPPNPRNHRTTPMSPNPPPNPRLRTRPPRPIIPRTTPHPPLLRPHHERRRIPRMKREGRGMGMGVGVGELGEVVVSCGLDWSVKIWRGQNANANVSTNGKSVGQASAKVREEEAALTYLREEIVYDVAWHPTRPSIFATVDGSGALDIFDIVRDQEISVARATLIPHPSTSTNARSRSLNKVRWETGSGDGRRVAVGGLGGVVSVFDVGKELGGEGGGLEEAGAVKRILGGGRR
ncbi:WD40 repeat-like protein [Saitoella complicata NRRL Y-17804]|uniref:WD40 repeat-like protein n=1 Tax=Saitoella complicata (strain BCRC 22490 / CBS 7301 / JCM 7358 / NBRC 10748 / NRRL Y-17804) TaxID=698492 RepID=UPI000866D290|nr:WD40 repeat-like protein [Saitoella complicata NRRL Y-17804]ODQ52244.1 WD40 repeat-like protein [Saitoella complicata NRRL Y-17804]